MNDPHEPEAMDATEQIARLLAFARKTAQHYRIVAIAGAIGLVSGTLFLLLRTPPYRSETVVLYTEGIRTSAEATAADGAPHEAGVRFREMLMSRKRLERLILDFDLYRETRERYGPVDAVEEFRQHIDFRAPGSDTYTIGFQGTSAVEARNVTAALAASLIGEDSQLRRQKAELTRDFLREERKRTEGELRNAEQELAQFLALHPTFALDSMLLMPGASPTGAAIRAAEAEELASRAPSGVIGRSGTRGPRLPSIPPDLAAEKARAEADFTAAQAALAQALTRFTRQHPDVRTAEASVARAQARLSTVTAAIASALSRSALTARPLSTPPAAGGKPTPSSDPKKVSQDQLVALETDWTRLIRTVGEARSRHEQIESSYFKADIAANSESESTGARMAILDPAYLPTRPAPPGRTVLLSIFVIVSLIIGGVVAMLKAGLDDRTYRPTDVERVGLQVLAAIPKERGAKA